MGGTASHECLVGYGNNREDARNSLNVALSYHYNVELIEDRQNGNYFVRAEDGSKRYVIYKGKNGLTRVFLED